MVPHWEFLIPHAVLIRTLGFAGLALNHSEILWEKKAVPAHQKWNIAWTPHFTDRPGQPVPRSLHRLDDPSRCEFGVQTHYDLRWN